MRFELHGQRVTYIDHEPDSHATLFDQRGYRALYDDAHSHFDNAVKRYAWAFNLEQPLHEGEHVTFATADRAVTGVRRGDIISVIPQAYAVNRSGVGKPLALKDQP